MSDDYYAQFHPKPRSGSECKKVKCSRYKDYKDWKPGSSNLKFCMTCKNAHVSQYSAIQKDKTK